MAKTKNNENIIRLLLILAYADGNYSLQERKFIKTICTKMKITNQEYRQIKSSLPKTKNNMVKECIDELRKIKSKILRNKVLTLLLELASADHILHEDEVMIFTLIADEWGMYKKKK